MNYNQLKDRPNTEKIDLLNVWINESNNIVFFGGAGVSTGSGIKDFRGENGLYNQKINGIHPEEILNAAFLKENPKEFYSFYKDFILKDYEPNIIHKKLAEWEKKGKLKAVITQNIDDLHKRCGCKNVYELHGNGYEFQCTNFNCQEKYDKSILNLVEVPYCKKCNSIIRPNVVFFNEPINTKNSLIAQELINKSDLFIICGTTLKVKPSNSLILNYRGEKMVLINNQKTFYDDNVDLLIIDDAIKTFSLLK